MVKHPGGELLAQRRQEGMAVDRTVGAVWHEHVARVVAQAIPERDVEMHRAAGLIFHRLGHECRIDAELQRHLAHDALEHDHLIGQRHRITVVEIDL